MDPSEHAGSRKIYLPGLASEIEVQLKSLTALPCYANPQRNSILSFDHNPL